MKSLKHGKNTLKPEVTNISEHGFWMLINGKEHFLPYDCFPWFKETKVSQITNFEVFQGNHFYWPELDVDLSLNIIEQPEKYRLVAK